MKRWIIMMGCLLLWHADGMAQSQNGMPAEMARKVKELDARSEALYEKGEYNAAFEPARESLAIRELYLGSEHPDVAQSLNGLAELAPQPRGISSGQKTRGTVSTCQPVAGRMYLYHMRRAHHAPPRRGIETRYPRHDMRSPAGHLAPRRVRDPKRGKVSPAQRLLYPRARQSFASSAAGSTAQPWLWPLHTP